MNNKLLCFLLGKTLIYKKLMLMFVMCSLVKTIYPMVVVSHEEFRTNNEVTQAKLQQAAQNGFFYLEMSENMKKYVSSAVDFAHSFYEDETLKTLKLPGFSGFHDREHAQVESFYAESALWSQTLPEDVQQFGLHTKDVELELLNILFELLIPSLSKATTNQIAGNVSTGEGLYHLSFNHYRPTKEVIGLAPHRDFGYLSILVINQKGLFAKLNNQWEAVEPRDDHVVVFLGKAFETLVNDTKKCSAVWHYVEKIQTDDRISLLLTSDNKLEMPLYRICNDGTYEVVFESYQKYLDDSFTETYKERDIA